MSSSVCSPLRLAMLVMAMTSPLTSAHIALWNKGMFGLNAPGPATAQYPNYNNAVPVSPLRGFQNLTEEEWFAHGFKDLPPAPGDFMELPSGGVFTGELACNRAHTTLGDPRAKGEGLTHYACSAKGAMHTANEFNQAPNNSLLGGTALAIAYTSDVASLKPTDMTIFSVNWTSVWTRETDYQIPKGMPKCPEGGCLCTWNWIHGAQHKEGYGSEIYNLLYRCNVTGDTDDSNSIPVGGAQVPAICYSAPQNCTKGPKQPMYLYQATGNNMPHQPTWPPSYNWRYGFPDGAQDDIFVGWNGTDATNGTSSFNSTFSSTPLNRTSPSSASNDTSTFNATSASSGSDANDDTTDRPIPTGMTNDTSASNTTDSSTSASYAGVSIGGSLAADSDSDADTGGMSKNTTLGVKKCKAKATGGMGNHKRDRNRNRLSTLRKRLHAPNSPIKA